MFTPRSLSPFLFGVIALASVTVLPLSAEADRYDDPVATADEITVPTESSENHAVVLWDIS